MASMNASSMVAPVAPRAMATDETPTLAVDPRNCAVNALHVEPFQNPIFTTPPVATYASAARPSGSGAITKNREPRHCSPRSDATLVGVVDHALALNVDDWRAAPDPGAKHRDHLVGADAPQVAAATAKASPPIPSGLNVTPGTAAAAPPRRSSPKDPLVARRPQGLRAEQYQRVAASR